MSLFGQITSAPPKNVTAQRGTVSRRAGYLLPESHSCRAWILHGGTLPPTRRTYHVTDDRDRTNADVVFEDAALACLDHLARFARSLTRSPSDADDLVQSTYLRAFRSRHTFQAGADMRRWLFTICKHVFLRDVERGARDVLADAADPTDDTLEAVRAHNRLAGSGEAALFDRLDLGPAIVTALATLAPPLRAAVVLVDLEGYDYADAADVMQVPIGTVRSRLFRARRALQEQLVQYGRDAGLVPPHAPRRTA